MTAKQDAPVIAASLASKLNRYHIGFPNMHDVAVSSSLEGMQHLCFDTEEWIWVQMYDHFFPKRNDEQYKVRQGIWKQAWLLRTSVDWQ